MIFAMRTLITASIICSKFDFFFLSTANDGSHARPHLGVE